MLKKEILAIGATALIARGIYFALMLQAHSLERILVLFPDSQHYVDVAFHLLGWKVDEEALFIVGPGYGAFLALVFSLFGYSALPVLLIQIVLSCLNCLLIYCIAKALLPGGSRAPLYAGMISAISLTSIALSCSVLTETLFFTIQAGALLCLICAIQLNRWSLMLASGMLLGIGTLIRSVAQWWWLMAALVIVILIPRKYLRYPKRELLYKVAAAAALTWLIVAVWSARNYAVTQVFTVAEVGIRTAREYWAVMAVSLAPDADALRVEEQQRARRIRLNTPTNMLIVQHNEDVGVIVDRLEHYPKEMLEAYGLGVAMNVLGGDQLHTFQLPQFREWWSLWDPVLAGVGLLILLLSGLGLFLLWRDSLMSGVVILSMTWVYYTLLSGFTFFQGSRVMFPTQMAWAVLVAWAAERMLSRFRL